MSRCLRRAFTCAVGALVSTAVIVGASGPASADSSVTLLGHGWGHGRGLGQWGAYGYAVDQGWRAGTILDHYYGGTIPGTANNSVISVRLVGLESSIGTWIAATQAFTVGGVHVDAGSAARVVRDGDNWSLFTSFNGCGATDNFGPYPLPANPTLRTVGSPGDDVFRMLHTCSTGVSYRGDLQFVADGGSTRLVNRLPLESYLRGVVPHESPASWGDAGGGRGIEALKAQAVAARSYALAEKRYWFAETCDTTSCQVYKGAGLRGARTEDARTDRAVAETAGVIRARNGVVVRTEFSASTGGRTTGPEFRHVNDIGDTVSPHRGWRVTLPGSDISTRYPQIGTFTSLRVTRRDGEGVQGGRVLSLDLAGTRGTVSVTGDQFRTAMGLKSTWFFPLEQATSSAFVKTRYSDTVYKQVRVGDWQDHYPVTWQEYAAEGYPAVGSTPTEYVKYPWSPTIYAVTLWPSNPLWEWKKLDYRLWERAGYPVPRDAGWIYGTAFWKRAGSSAVYADAPDGTTHELTYAEWAAAGYPKPETR